MTNACCEYFIDYFQLFDYVAFTSTLVMHTDETRLIAAEALYKIYDDEEEREEARKTIEEGKITQKRFRPHIRLVLEMMMCRAVDNFLCYISGLLALIFTTMPETMRTSETIKIKDVLVHNSMKELIHALAEERVNKLSYHGMKELQEWLSNQLGFILFLSEPSLNEAIRIIEIRNLLVHNRGLINNVILTRVPTLQYEVGERIKIDVRDAFDNINFLALSVSDIDVRASKKFQLDTPISRNRLEEKISTYNYEA